MKVSISKSEIGGSVVVPASKSYTIRGLMCAALARGESRILHPLASDDTTAAARVLEQIGVQIAQEEGVWRVSGGDFHAPEGDLFCGDSAATLRFMTAICALVPGKCRLTAGPSLSQRPVKPLVDALQKLGVNCSCRGELPPVVVEGGLRGGETSLQGNISSQYVSALLFIAPFAEQGMTISLTTPLESKPYVLMTLDCMQKFGVSAVFPESLDRFEVANQSYRPAGYAVEGDWTSASYFVALGALSRGLAIANLNAQSLQGDKIMLHLTEKMGASVKLQHDSIRVKGARLKAIQADLTDYIDLLPTLAVMAAVAEGQSELGGIGRARLKESDRVAAVTEGLTRLGIKAVAGPNLLTITGGQPGKATIDSRGDHRIAMAFSVLGCACGGVTIDGAECVAKTFPQFWDILKSIGGRLEITNAK